MQKISEGDIVELEIKKMVSPKQLFGSVKFSKNSQEMKDEDRRGCVEGSLATKYFLDTYAMLEFPGGNRACLKYISGTELGTSILNLIELHYHFLRDGGEKKADDSYRFFRQYEVAVKPIDIRNSMKFRLSSRARKTDVSQTKR